MQGQKTKQPLAVLISDVHYSLSTLEVADKATRMAVAKSNKLGIPLVVCGDLHDSKANLRGECVKAMIETFKLCSMPAIILVGNHDLINERSEDNSLEFLKPYASIVSQPVKNLLPGWTFIPYQSDTVQLKTLLNLHKHNLIMHQGIEGSNAGHYIKDKSALRPEDLAGRRVISGHYHTRQTIELPDGGTFDYVGNPYTLNFAEASDPAKGFQVLYDDNSLEFVPTNLRKHVVAKIIAYEDGFMWGSEGRSINKEDLLQVKLSGPSEVLALWNKDRVRTVVEHDNFRLDLIPTETKTTKTLQSKNNTPAELMDKLIDSLTETTNERKKRLKTMWKDFA